MPTRTMPNNLEAEESVLGSCFLSKYALQKATETLTAESFYNDRNAKIFQTMVELQEKNTPIQIICLICLKICRNLLNLHIRIHKICRFT